MIPTREFEKTLKAWENKKFFGDIHLLFNSSFEACFGSLKYLALGWDEWLKILKKIFDPNILENFLSRVRGEANLLTVNFWFNSFDIQNSRQGTKKRDCQKLIHRNYILSRFALKNSFSSRASDHTQLGEHEPLKISRRQPVYREISTLGSLEPLNADLKFPIWGKMFVGRSSPCKFFYLIARV